MCEVRDSVTDFGKDFDFLWQSPSTQQEKEVQSLKLFAKHEIEVKQIGDSFAVRNGVVANILITPHKRLIVFKDSKRSYYITTSFDAMYGMIFGTMKFKKEGE